jgi:hypothetical protein
MSCPAMDTPFISDTAFTSESSDLDQDMVGQTLCTVRGRESLVTRTDTHTRCHQRLASHHCSTVTHQRDTVTHYTQRPQSHTTTGQREDTRTVALTTPQAVTHTYGDRAQSRPMCCALALSHRTTTPPSLCPSLSPHPTSDSMCLPRYYYTTCRVSLPLHPSPDMSPLSE